MEKDSYFLKQLVNLKTILTSHHDVLNNVDLIILGGFYHLYKILFQYKLRHRELHVTMDLYKKLRE